MPSLAIIQSKHYPHNIHRFYHRLLFYIDFGLPYFRKFEKDFCETHSFTAFQYDNSIHEDDEKDDDLDNNDANDNDNDSNSKRTKVEIEILNPFSPIPVLKVSVRLSCRPAQLVASSGERASKRRRVGEPALAWEGGGGKTG